MNRKAYPSDVKDDEWEFVAPYLTLMNEEHQAREYSLREVFNGLRWLVRMGASWRMMPHDLPPWDVRSFTTISALNTQRFRWRQVSLTIPVPYSQTKWSEMSERLNAQKTVELTGCA